MRRIQRLLLSQLPHAPYRPQGKVDGQAHEDQEGEDLKGESGDEYVIARRHALVLVAGRRGNATSRGLQEQRSDVTGNEDARVGQGLDARVGGAKGHDDAGESEVETSGEERRRNRQAAYLDKERVLSQKG